MAKRKMSAKELKARDAKRDIGAELLEAATQMKAGEAGRVHHVAVPEIVAARNNVGLSQQKFAALLGVSSRTLQEWEQGRRKPSGAARTLLTIAKRRPEVIAEIAAV